MFPYKTSFSIDRNSNQAIYVQISNQFISFISQGKLPAGTKLPGTRSLALLLNVHRKTAVSCYEELDLQGWVESVPKKGTFVKEDLPLLDKEDYQGGSDGKKNNTTGFSFYSNAYKKVKLPVGLNNDTLFLNDGISDARLAPTIELGRIYRKIASKKDTYKYLSYGSAYGNMELRKVLVSYLNATRGLQITVGNLLITRGSQMGIWLSAQLLLKKDDVIVVGETNYPSADITFLERKASIARIPVDKEGLCVSFIEALCKKQPIKAVYVTSHHHHPTTVTLSAERRINLLNLSKLYQFAIIEDDYDYDFNYNHSPILPLASHDVHGNVIYIGSICKTVAPVFRIGYLIASKPFVDEAAYHRRFVDRQGDALLELTFAEFIKSGDLDRHIRKVMKIYKQRRDLFCALLTEHLSDYFYFDIPKGGMALWLILSKKYSWGQVAKIAEEQNLAIGEWQRYDFANTKYNGIRVGFATYNNDEMKSLIYRLQNTMKLLVL